MALPSMPLQVVITSYNRGRFLAHCVGSVEQCMPYANISVWDDNSDDSETLGVLDRIAARHTVNRVASGSGGKHGGLYSHMQAALDSAQPDTLLMYLQDDVQLVRPVTREEIAALAELFHAEPALGFVSPTFIPTSGKGRSGGGDFDYDPRMRVFSSRVTDRSVGVHYSDINLCLPSRLRQVGWQFGHREPECETLARRYFRSMLIPALPFVAWLPLVPAYRGKRKTWALRQAEQQRNAAFHPFNLLAPEEITLLQSRRTPPPPWAEDMLTLRDAALPRPWHHNPLQGRRWLKRLNNIEASLVRLLGSVHSWFKRYLTSFSARNG